MTTRTEYAHGEFCWADLGTTDAAAAKKFYAGILGWQYDDIPAGPAMTYTMGKLGDRATAGLYAMNKEMLSRNVPPHWQAHINVTNVDAATKRATQNGAKVMMEPFDAMDAGRASILQDPTGAVIALWQAKKHIGAEIVMEPGSMCWNELMTPNVEAAGRFYRTTFDWTAEPMDMGPGGTYTIFKAGTIQIGGMMARPAEMKDVPPHWLTYFAVADCDRSAAKVKELGGAVLRPPTDIPNIGRFAVCRDGQGAAFALFKPQNP